MACSIKGMIQRFQEKSFSFRPNFLALFWEKKKYTTQKSQNINLFLAEGQSSPQACFICLYANSFKDHLARTNNFSHTTQMIAAI